MINKKALISKYLINNIITFITLVMTIVFYDKVNIGYANLAKLGFCLTLPLLSLFQSLLLIILSLSENKNNKGYYLISKYLTLIFNFSQILILLSILSVDISLLTIFIETLGLSLLIIGNYLPKLKESHIVKTLSFKVNNDVNKWNTFTRVAGFTYILIGLFIMILGIINDPYIIVIAFSLILLSGVILQLYSITLGKR